MSSQSFNSDEYILNSRSPKPSHITLPPLAHPYPALLDFLDSHFHLVGRKVWQERLEQGKILDEEGNEVTPATPYRVNARLSYYREVAAEPRIPFEERIIYEDERIIIADKPHFLPVTPSGNAVNECLLHRLMHRTGNLELVPCHRLDRDTAGLVLLSKNPQSRKLYYALFSQGNINKHYEAIGRLPEDIQQREWLVKSRIEPFGKWSMQHNVAGKINARSRIFLQEIDEARQLGRFALSPITGKTHQLRLHMGLIGAWILHDKLYPEPARETDRINYDEPLQLVAKQLDFIDPVSNKAMRFQSSMELMMLKKIK